jgi:putative oxidoreductase
MKIAILISRVFLGLGFVIFGLNILHPFLPMPAPVEGTLNAQFMAVMWPTHWMMVVGLFQVVGGLLVLLGRTAPLGLLILAPLLVNILCFHVLIQNGEGIAPGIVFTAFEIFLLNAYWSYFRAIFTTHAIPKA